MLRFGPQARVRPPSRDRPSLVPPNMIENQDLSFIQQIPLSLILFVFSFGTLAAFIDSADTNAFLLQQLGIESIVERGHVYLEGSETPQFQLNIPLESTVQPQGDFLLYKRHVYPAKQPGQFFIGSLVYFCLHRSGLTYKTDLTLTGGLVTLLTSALMTATMIVLIMEILFVITGTRSISVLIALFFGFGTPIFPYSGVTHHDMYGTFFSVLALFFLFYNYRNREMPNGLQVLFSGFCAGFALFSSMLQIANTIVLTLYVLAQKRVSNVLLFSLGCLTGIMPIFLFNWMIFNHPLNFYNKVGNFPDLTPMFATTNILHKLDFYLLSPASSIGFYSPVFLVSLLGFALFPRK
jgi:hypothetical protein